MSHPDIFAKSAEKHQMGAYRALYSPTHESEWKGHDGSAGIDKGYLIVADPKGRIFKATCLVSGVQAHADMRRRYPDIHVVCHAEQEDELCVLVNAVGQLDEQACNKYGIYPDVGHIERMVQRRPSSKRYLGAGQSRKS